MFGRRLKTNIVVSITLLLFIGMLLIDFVAVKTLQRDLIKSKGNQGFLMTAMVKQRLFAEKETSTSVPPGLKSLFADMLAEKEVLSINLMASSGKTIYAAEKGSIDIPDLKKAMLGSLSSKKPKMLLSGSTWGVFWKQSRYLLIADPIDYRGERAAVGMVIDLEEMYRLQRRAQRFTMLYLLANTLIFALIGFYRLSRLYLEPINRLVAMAEDYQEEDGTFFPVRKEDNELNTLSKALNLMLNRISEDKKKLRSSVASLEKANLKLKQAQEEIIRAEKLASVGRLSSGIAHEIGNPIGIVMGYLELIKQKDLDEEEMAEYVERTENEINRINKVINQLLELSRPSSKGTQHISVHDIIHEISDVLKLQPLMSGIRLDLSLGADRDAVVADADQLRQVFLNLAINAADAIKSTGKSQNGRIRIATRTTTENDLDEGAVKRWMEIAFDDNGPGIAEGCMNNIFDPFFTTKEPGKGTGLGLSVSFMIIESFGGTIKAGNPEEGGARVSIRLPVDQ